MNSMTQMMTQMTIESMEENFQHNMTPRRMFGVAAAMKAKKEEKCKLVTH